MSPAGPRRRIYLKPTFEALAIEILGHAGKPMHYREITDLVRKKRPMGGETPYKTGYSVLHKSPAFDSLGEGVFTLRRKRGAKST
jgi:hypothetical protein